MKDKFERDSLTEEQKQTIIDEANELPDEDDGNTSLFALGEMEDLKPFLKELTPLEMFDKSVVLNNTSMANLDDLLPRLSKKNLIKLFFATMKLPEKGASLKFGGTKEQKALCEIAFANSQLARNALVHVLGTSAIAQARLVKQREEDLKEQTNNENSIKEETNE